MLDWSVKAGNEDMDAACKEDRVIVDKEAMLIYVYNLVKFQNIKMFLSILL